MRAIWAVIFGIGIWFVSPAAFADEPPAAPAARCPTAQRALDHWLSNLQPDNHHPSEASECFDWSGAGTPPDHREELAAKLKKVLDAEGLWVDLAAISNDPEESSERITPFPHNLPVFYLVKRPKGWVISSETIAATEALYGETFSFSVDNLLERLPTSLDFLRDGIGGFAYWKLLGLLVSFLVALVARSVITFVVTSQGVRVLERMGLRAGGELVRNAARPIGTLAMAGILFYVLPALQFSVGINKVLVIALRVLAALAGVMVVYRIVDVVADVFERRAASTATKLDDQLVPLLRKSVKVFVAAIGFIFVLQNLNVDVASLLAGASLGGLAFTLAAKDTVANLFGSLSIFADRPFQIGDWVLIAGVEGTVEEVGMRTTRVRTFYDSLVTIPNAKIADSVVDNYGARTYRRVLATLRLRYDTTPEQMQAFCEGVRAILQANESVRKDYYEVVMSGFGDDSLEVMLYFFFKVDTWSAEILERHNVFLEILRLARELSVDFALPSQTLHLASVAAPEPGRAREVPPDNALRSAVLAFGPGGARARPAGPKLTHGFFAGESGKGGDGDAAADG